ncbi:bifunctional proline dehydrogenase/L-glutamate gamma-semialdehyde dehydrogenase [Arthrobacter sp. I2-34]|uniref:L-glutamate gamma-semialdehyde dehydrogenase n=1 Tax=Arthrobacter hankyongi TaxID=2904801 RepID=A0ABS9LCT1_9MICC|nr:bifunctional proline dehydrogenase/L-glutamate gamma-semialdehyde dehydrogenase [Arthrobacter hankyongi]MCG2624262.1 bifunctional proline dehydrogenase/L-glutamate gamma-semialdehyde dehydrogenase [Arthrobacter hankyongi]
METRELAATLADDSVRLVRHWLDEASHIPVDASARQLAGVLRDPHGLEFTVGFVDGVIRPEDPAVAARNLAALARRVPAFLPWYLRGAVRVGGALAPVLPGVVIPAARRALREMVGHLIVDASDAKLGPAIAKIRRADVRLNINLLGEAVLGEREAGRRLEGLHRLLARDDVDYVSVKVSAAVGPHAPFAFEEAVAHTVAKLSPLFARAAAGPAPKFINLDMEEYKDLEMTIAVFTRLLDQPEFKQLEAGIVLQAYLPDALSAMIRLQEWAAARTAAGGAPIKVRVVKGANLPMEHVEASLHGWPVATWGSKQDTDTNYKRVINYALDPGRIRNVRIGVAGHNLFDVAFAWLLAKRRGIESGGHGGLEFEMLLGMAQSQAEAVRRDVGSLLLYTPVVHPAEFDVAIAYLIRRLEEGASRENFMSAVFELSEDEALFEREKQRFLASLANLDDEIPAPNRSQDRSRPEEPAPPHGFRNTPDTDPSLPANLAWGRAILDRVPGSTLGKDAVAAATLHDAEALDAVMDTAAEAGAAWGALTGAKRAEILHRAGDLLEARRADLLEVMAAEAGKTLDQGDPEVSEAVDFAHYYAERARELDAVDGAVFIPSRVTVVTPPWNFPVAIPAGSTLAALAAGSAVVIKPAHPAARCGAVMVEAVRVALAEAGMPRDVLRLVQLNEHGLGRELIAHPAVDRVILTGGYETAELFRSFRPDLPLLAETSGKNAIIVTPDADFDLAARDVAYSAFGHAGQKCSAASLVILVGSAARSRRFRNQLVDAVTSLKVGYPQDPATQMGPVIEAPAGKLLAGLTTLGDGESWLLKPEQLDGTGKLWSPGIRTGVRPGSHYHLTEFFGPILGVMTAADLAEAVEIQNEVDYGLTAGLHSLDREEIGYWLDHVQAGNLYVNRGITGAIVRRQPFGGWKKSAVGPGTKAGGPNYLVGLGSWTSAPGAAGTPVADAGAARLLDAARSSGGAIEAAGVAGLERALRSDAAAWAAGFGRAQDVSGLAAERNVFRYLPLPVTIRLAAGEPLVKLVRVLAAGVLAGSEVTVSTAVELPASLKAAAVELGIRVTVEDDAAWLAGAGRLTGRIRLIGGGARALAAATGGRPDLAVYAHDVTESGRVELLPFLHEQAVSITAHRFGTPSHLSDGLI